MDKKNNHVRGVSVQVRDDNVEKALRKFKRKAQDANRIQEVRDRMYYEKPTTQRKKAKAAARSRWLKKQAKSNLTSKRLY